MNFNEVKDIVVSILIWILQILLWSGLSLAFLCTLDRLLDTIISLFYWLKIGLFGKRPENDLRYIDLNTIEAEKWPKIAIQIPIFNDREVAEQVIKCCCAFDWPKENLIIQILDDSTCEETREVVNNAIIPYQQYGIPIFVHRRTNREGYKAGALKEALNYPEMSNIEYIAIFDSDFTPKPSFLKDTVPYMIANNEISYVQGRWTFSNGNETFITQAQEISLNWHHLCENFAHSSMRSYFHFNGTAGIWRKSVMDEAGGWLSRTTVEDADLSLRVFCNGYKPLYLPHITVRNELPASIKAYRQQQHRWSCGPVVLCKLMWFHIWRSSKISLHKKFYLTFMYYGLHKILAPMIFLFYFVTFPVIIVTGIEKFWLPIWALWGVMGVSILSVFGTVLASGIKGLFLTIPWVLFENCIALVRINAIIVGLCESKRANEWIVTQKAGKNKKKRKSDSEYYFREILFGFYLIAIAGAIGYFRYKISLTETIGVGVCCFIQGIAFIAFGFGFIDSTGLCGSNIMCCAPNMTPLTPPRTPVQRSIELMVNPFGPITINIQ